MINRYELLAFLILVLGTLIASVTESNPACGATLGPGAKVTLDGDLSCNGPTYALTLLGSVTLDLNGFVVSCSGTTPVGIRVQGQNNVVNNGTVTGCSSGIQIAGQHHRVENTTITSNGTGIEVFAGQSTIKNNTATGNLIGIGDTRGSAGGNRFTGNTTNSNNQGMIVDDNETASDNTANGNTYSGIVCGYSNKISRNTTNNNWGYGIGVAGTGNVLSRNTASSNTSGDFYVDCSTNTSRNNYPEPCP
jgi:parallel beta-helix repeat protein